MVAEVSTTSHHLSHPLLLLCREDLGQAASEEKVPNQSPAPALQQRDSSQGRVRANIVKDWQQSAPAKVPNFIWIRLWSNLCQRVLSNTTEQSMETNSLVWYQQRQTSQIFNRKIRETCENHSCPNVLEDCADAQGCTF